MNRSPAVAWSLASLLLCLLLVTVASFISCLFFSHIHQDSMDEQEEAYRLALRSRLQFSKAFEDHSRRWRRGRRYSIDGWFCRAGVGLRRHIWPRRHWSWCEKGNNLAICREKRYSGFDLYFWLGGWTKICKTHLLPATRLIDGERMPELRFPARHPTIKGIVFSKIIDIQWSFEIVSCRETKRVWMNQWMIDTKMTIIL